MDISRGSGVTFDQLQINQTAGVNNDIGVAQQSRARTVIRSAAPGPAPTKETCGAIYPPSNT
jgi:hypothetical protein